MLLGLSSGGVSSWSGEGDPTHIGFALEGQDPTRPLPHPFRGLLRERFNRHG